MTYDPRYVRGGMPRVGSGPSPAPQVGGPGKQTRVMELEARMPSARPPLTLDTPGSDTEHEAEHLGAEVAREASTGERLPGYGDAQGEPEAPLPSYDFEEISASHAMGSEPNLRGQLDSLDSVDDPFTRDERNDINRAGDSDPPDPELAARFQGIVDDCLAEAGVE